VYRRIYVSIHAPAWGATAETGSTAGAVVVSIHAPAWGATRAHKRQRPATRSFNPRPRMGGDVLKIYGGAFMAKFQSTPPHGGRHRNPADQGSRPVFQSTPPHGGRRNAAGLRARQGWFQSTPPHGGRLLCSDPVSNRL